MAPPPFRADLWKIGAKTVAPGLKDIGSQDAQGFVRVLPG